MCDKGKCVINEKTQSNCLNKAIYKDLLTQQVQNTDK